MRIILQKLYASSAHDNYLRLDRARGSAADACGYVATALREITALVRPNVLTHGCKREERRRRRCPGRCRPRFILENFAPSKFVSFSKGADKK